MSADFNLYFHDSATTQDIGIFFRSQLQKIGVPVSSEHFAKEKVEKCYIYTDLLEIFIYRPDENRLNTTIMEDYKVTPYNFTVIIQTYSSMGYVKTRTCMLQLVDALLRRDDRDLVLEFNGEFPVLFRRGGKVYINHQFDDGTKFPFHVITLPTEVVHMPVR